MGYLRPHYTEVTREVQDVIDALRAAALDLAGTKERARAERYRELAASIQIGEVRVLRATPGIWRETIINKTEGA